MYVSSGMALCARTLEIVELNLIERMTQLTDFRALLYLYLFVRCVGSRWGLVVEDEVPHCC